MKTDYFEEDKSPSLSAISSGSQVQVDLFRIYLIFWEFYFEETTSKDSLRSGTKFFFQSRTRKWYSSQFIQDETQRFRTIEGDSGIVFSRYSTKGRRTQIHPTEKYGTPILGPENERQELRCEER